MITFKQYLQEKLNWKRAALVGGTTIGASALAGVSKGGFGLGPLGGAAIGAGIGAVYYTASGNLKKDLKKKPKDWNYDKKRRVVQEEWYRLSNGSKTNDYQTWKRDYEKQKQQRIKDALSQNRRNKDKKKTSE